MIDSSVFEDLTYDEIFVVAGHCLHAWTGVEIQLADLFVQIHDTPPEAVTPLRAAFDCVNGFEIRLDMLTASIEADKRLVGPFQEAWAPLHNFISKKSKKRNQVAHFLVGKLSDDHDAALYPFPTATKVLTEKHPPLLSAADLRARRDSFQLLERRLYRLCLYVQQARNRLPEYQPPADDPARWLQMPAALTPASKLPPPQSSGA